MPALKTASANTATPIQSRTHSLERGTNVVVAAGGVDGRGAQTGLAEVFSGEIELHHADRHEESTGAEAGAQAEEILRDGDDQGTQSTADIDADIEDRKCRIEARAAFRIEAGHDGADIGFQQPDAQHDDQKADVEALRAGR